MPQGEDAPPGAYVAMPREALLAVARIEAARAGATVIGEDLGNIPEGLRDALEASGVLGCRVAQFERHWEAEGIAFKRAKEYASGALTSFGTHDLPTWEGWKAGRDIDWRRHLGYLGAEGHAAAMAERAGGRGGLRADSSAARGPTTSTGSWRGPPRALIACQIEDVLGRVEQPNLPGTVHEHPNWRRRLGVAPDALGQLDAMACTVTIMAEAER